MFNRNKLVCYATLPDGYGFEATIAAAAKAGFNELSLWLMSVAQARDELGSLEAVRDCMAHYQMRPTCLELLSAWPRGDAVAAAEELAVMRAAIEVFEPELVLAACMETRLAQGSLPVELLRKHCQGFAPTRVALEFLPWSAVGSLDAAQRLVEQVGEPNLGYVLDTWHFARTGQDYAALARLPGEKIFFIQCSDAAAVVQDDVIAETLGARLPPGEGVVDWPRLNTVLQAMGVDCPVGTEMFSDVAKAMPLDEACSYLYSSLQRGLK